MLRNAVVAGLVAVVMSGFVLSYQAAVPESTQPPQMADGTRQPAVDRQMPQAQEPAAANGQVAAAGQPMTAQQQPQGQTTRQTQTAMGGGAMQGKSGMGMGMGMCPMMKMMMGGAMQSEQSDESEAATQATVDQAALQREVDQLRREVERLKRERSQ